MQHNPKGKRMSNIFVKIGHGIKWVVVKIGDGFKELPRLITLTHDAEQLGSQALPEVLLVLEDVKDLATATVKDGGVFLTGLTALGGALAEAAQAGGVNAEYDAAVLAAVKTLAADFKAQNVADILAAWKALVDSAHSLDQTILADLKKLETDAA
jgi:hypothetical protein